MKFLTFFPQFSQLPMEGLMEFFSKSEFRVYKKKSFFISEGEICDKVMFIQKGIFKTYITAKGKEHVKDIMVDSIHGFHTAYASLVRQEPSRFYIEAIEDSEVYVWKAEYINQQLQTDVNWAMVGKQLVDFFLLRKEEREVSLLKDSAEKRYRDFCTEYKDAAFRIPQTDIASYLGIAPESLSRIRKQIYTKEKNSFSKEDIIL